MSALAGVKTDGFGLQPLDAPIRNAEGRLGEVVELGTHDVRRLDGDHRWRMIICMKGEIWVTQERDLQDYVLTAGDMFIITQSGRVLIEALCDAAVGITSSLKRVPYRGDYLVFQ
jgi:hypothetical protein